MTLLEKDGPSTAPDEGEYLPDQKYHYDFPEPAVPPSYADTMGAGTSRAAAAVAASVPTTSNFVSLRERHGEIKGTWALDTNLQVPLGLLRPLESETEIRPNLQLNVVHGSIRANVSLAATPGKTQRAVVDLSATHGSIDFKLTSRLNRQPFKLKAVTQHGEIAVAIPRDFVGPIRCRLRHGKIKSSDALGANLVKFTEEISFIGDWTGFVDFDQWEGDEVELEAAHAKFKLSYIDEGEERCQNQEDAGARLKKRGRGGFWGRRNAD